MSNSNARLALEILYGARCFITGEIDKRTYHHLLKKALGGKATVENGVILNRDFHNWLHSLENTNLELFDLINDCMLTAKGIIDKQNSELMNDWEYIRGKIILEKNGSIKKRKVR